MRQLLNEGRIVGLSQYELYVKQMLAENPDGKILSEREWLGATIGSGSSMILKVEAGTTKGYHDYQLPEGSDLCGCSVIYGSMFEGELSWDSTGIWADRVDDYGPLVSNVAKSHPVTPGNPEDVPTKDNPTVMDTTYMNRCREYVKVTSALVFQQGVWTDNIAYETLTDEYENDILNERYEELLAPVSDKKVIMTLKPDLSERGFVRLLLSDDIDNEFYIIFTGFLLKHVISGVTGFDDILVANNPENGDFLGPESFPWACKVNLVISTDVFKVITTDIKNSLSPSVQLEVTDSGKLGYYYNGQLVLLDSNKLVTVATLTTSHDDVSYYASSDIVSSNSIYLTCDKQTESEPVDSHSYFKYTFTVEKAFTGSIEVSVNNISEESTDKVVISGSILTSTIGDETGIYSDKHSGTFVAGDTIILSCYDTSSTLTTVKIKLTEE